MNAILVDLNGTVIDSRPGVLASYRTALRQLGAAVPDIGELEWVIGPPLRGSFAKLLGPGGDVEEAVCLYRHHYREKGIYDAHVYDGMPDALAEIRKSPGGKVLLCTAKALPYARQIIEHFRLGDLFDGLYGAEFGGRFDDKGELIAHIVEYEGVDPRRAVIIWDRDNDVRAARRHFIPSIGALWGYGSIDELEGAGVTVLCRAPEALPSVVRSVLASHGGPSRC
ncbi:HAD family hydrolase [Salinarimonas soli]|uniref:HAD hydrolase-like protein n=1 Tax=Salinarimonas soli TaxID=1638099 RepID=A0A5B2V8V2_9HYPH|nr:HAD family hydrolase [Salinarimonas soli]KAA2235923.1 HAD hydrolase-like protein [Salinarimonas soli]